MRKIIAGLAIGAAAAALGGTGALRRETEPAPRRCAGRTHRQSATGVRREELLSWTRTGTASAITMEPEQQERQAAPDRRRASRQRAPRALPAVEGHRKTGDRKTCAVRRKQPEPLTSMRIR